MATIGFLNINGNDAFTTYGIVVKPKNYAKLLKFPTRKDNGLTTNFKDENGEDVYLSAPKYEAVNLALPFWICGNNELDFFNKYAAFRTLMLTGAEMNWDFLKMGGSGRRFKLYYKEMSDFDTLTKTSGGNKVYCEFIIALKNNHPTTVFSII
ncbi:hypothetical protein [Pedobacter sp.]